MVAALVRGKVSAIAMDSISLSDGTSQQPQDLHNKNIMIVGIQDGPKYSDMALKRSSVKIMDLGLSTFKESARAANAPRCWRLLLQCSAKRQ